LSVIQTVLAFDASAISP